MLGLVLVGFGVFDIVPKFTDTESYIDFSWYTVMYGLYFGLLSRDLYYSADRLAIKMLPEGVCAVCSGTLKPQTSRQTNMHEEYEDDGDGLLGETKTSKPRRTDASSNTPPNVLNESVHTLNCRHAFHSSCIRGWCVIGKRDICPYWYCSNINSA
ncbi:hypothetical protein H4219_000585 [Mycoemilia scoparia]|uniref:RING-type domain-containing protein n=1 Tax=Mycoemilia scoparia TaxID=417184 RepID=A0A9W8DWG7_9FUNG|nr:hypothetical protein H4219_000585 [Mycoemilia scoparia]